MTKRTTLALVIACLEGAALMGLVACGGSPGAGAGGTLATGGGAGSGGTGGSGMAVDSPSSLAAYTVSYRSGVRVPAANAVLSADSFVSQVSNLDPISAVRCPVSREAEYQAVADALGGVSWTHPVEILKDLSVPPLYRGKIPPPLAAPTAGTADGRDASAAPTIERPDLVGFQEGIAIFLSQRHGLLAVKTDGPRPALSCALKLPGNAKYFFYHGKELVLLVNGLRVNQAALMRFGVTADGFDFIDAVMLDRQQILDARLFDQTLVVYATLFPPPASTSAGTGGSSGAGSGSASSGAAAGAPVPTPLVPNGGSSSSAGLGVKMTAVKWQEKLTLAWSEEFPNDPVVSDPFAGRNPVDAAKQYAVGDVVNSYRSYKPFISASDRYVVMSRDVFKTVFTGTVSQTYSYCAASHAGPDRSVTYCTPKYEQRKNPDYRDPQTNKGDYPCNGKDLLTCIQEAAPVVSRYIYVRVGETCNTYTYHDYICDRYETQTVSYPTYRTDRFTQFVVYRYAEGDFVKLDEQLYQMASPGTTSGSVPTLTFTGKPLEVAGAIDHKGDLQFQQGHFYVLTNQGQQLHTLLITGNSIAELGLQNTPRRGGTYSYSGGHSTLFSEQRMMVSRAYTDSSAPNGIYTWSDVLMLDLTAPSFPKALNQFVMPGSSDQLILAKAGVLGPGTVNYTNQGVQRNLQKLTLFNQSDAAEIDNLLLGTEFNANFVQSWLGVADDQRIRLDGPSQRLFMPYGGYHHTPAEVYNPVAHRLNITSVGTGTGLTSEITFDLIEDIIRTVAIDPLDETSPNRALAFGDSSVYVINQAGPQGWSVDALRELATPMAVYRLSDKDDLHARIDRIGPRCQISTFRGSLHAFDATTLAAGPKIECTESGSPVAVSNMVVFQASKTGWRISADGLTITALTADEVTEALKLVRSDVYCALDNTRADGTPVPYLDAVPANVWCFPQGRL